MVLAPVLFVLGEILTFLDICKRFGIVSRQKTVPQICFSDVALSSAGGVGTKPGVGHGLPVVNFPKKTKKLTKWK